MHTRRPQTPKPHREAYLARISTLKLELEQLKADRTRLRSALREWNRYDYKPRRGGATGSMFACFSGSRTIVDAEEWRRCLLNRANIRNLMEKTEWEVVALQKEMDWLLLALPARNRNRRITQGALALVGVNS